MLKQININKKIIIILLLINIIVIGISSSYALFQTTIKKNSFIKIQSGNTKITTTIDGYNDNLITLSSGESKTLNITLTNESSDYDILYKMYYTVESGEGLILVTDATSDTSGTMKGEKSLSLTIQNNNASDLSIKIETIGALLMEEITLLDGQYELIGDTEPPIISNISDAGEGKITFTVSDTGSGVDKYCVNQNAEDTTNCTWITAVEGEQTTDVITSENGNYYVHVKDLAGNIGHSNVVTISFSISATDFITQNYGTGGLIAVNTSGTLYDGTGTIREYRYSGATVNNYIKFNSGEMWRIIGIFKNSSGDWNLKIMRNTMLTSAELPSTYTYNGASHTIENGTTGYAYWNKAKTGVNYNDWTTAGLQYYLNGTDGYYGTLSSGAKALVDTSYKYYLGNVTNYNKSADDTTITSYTHERGSTVCGASITSYTQNNNCNVWYGNKATWSGKVALLYPSDYGYSADSSYWSSTTLYNYGDNSNGTGTVAYTTSWMQTTTNHSYYEWMLSPSSVNSERATRWDASGFVYGTLVYYDLGYGDIGVRPVLNLLSTAEIDTNHQGTEANPYVVIE